MFYPFIQTLSFTRDAQLLAHLNGKAERSQKTDKTELYATVDIYSEDIDDLLLEWQHYYNWDRGMVLIKANHQWIDILN